MRDRVRLLWAALAIGGLCLPPSPAAAALAPAAEAEAGEAAAAGTGGPDEAQAPDADDAANRGAAASPPLAEVVAEALGPRPADARLVASWVVASGDNGEVPFMVIDKVAAAVFVFDAQGEYLGEAPVLLGAAAGDDATPGVGNRPLARMGPEEKTTPAGRFAARYGPAAGGRNVLWVDYSTSVALHEVVTGNRRERRLQRLRSATPEDNRITFGCINVPVAFHREVIRPLFRENGGIVYVLPETRPLEAVFPSVRVRSSWRRQGTDSEQGPAWIAGDTAPGSGSTPPAG
jgi:hypothetical protein